MLQWYTAVEMAQANDIYTETAAAAKERYRNHWKSCPNCQARLEQERTAVWSGAQPIELEES